METHKKIHSTWQRQYRQKCTPREHEVTFQVVLAESDLQIIATHNLATPMLKTLGQLRADISSWMQLYPEFRTSLEPLPIPDNAPEIVQRMYQGAQFAGVGPFAAVAGTVAQMLAETHANESPELIVENGGDIYMYSRKERVVGLLADPQSGVSIGLALQAEDFPVALCASSATIGHSLSLGQGELAVVRAKDASVADALATALGNRLRTAKDVHMVLEFGQKIPNIEGIFVQCDAAIGAWGKMELVAI